MPQEFSLLRGTPKFQRGADVDNPNTMLCSLHIVFLFYRKAKLSLLRKPIVTPTYNINNVSISNSFTSAIESQFRINDARMVHKMDVFWVTPLQAGSCKEWMDKHPIHWKDYSDVKPRFHSEYITSFQKILRRAMTARRIQMSFVYVSIK